jgi:regulator of ribonuclease activity A
MNTQFKTTDICDQFENDADSGLQVAEPLFRHFGGVHEFFGEIVTLSVFEDNALVKKILSEKGDGKVLVVDGGGSTRTALMGDQIGASAEKNGWAGAVFFGGVRDVDALAKLKIGVVALGATPHRSAKEGEGTRNAAVEFAGVQFIPGQFIAVDNDGIVVLNRKP